MLPLYLTTTVLTLSTLCGAQGFDAAKAKAGCKEIASKISDASEILYPLQPGFGEAIRHWFLSSTEIPTCVLNAGSPGDISTAIKIIGANRLPFAIKSGGHGNNPGGSSTKGVHIWPGRMNQVNISADKKTVELGFGLTWADVYKKLDGTGLGVTGGRVPGPGVGGFALGGGYSWQTNQHGLTIDTIKSYTFVLPNGTITKVDSSTPDLFFALRGGLNKFGIATSAEFYTHQQGPVYAGLVFYGPTEVPGLVEATAKFDAENTDDKAQVITTLEGGSLPGINSSSISLFFYDGPQKPEIFKLFDGLVGLDLRRTQSFSSFVSSVPSTLAFNAQGAFGTLCVRKFTATFLKAVLDENNKAGYQALINGGGPFPLSFEIDPFGHDYGKFATDSAYPHADSPLPLAFYASWITPAKDSFWYNYMRESLARLRALAQAEGILHPIQYSNYALPNTTAEALFGTTNTARLRRIRAEVDPNDVMGLTGGFAI